MTRDALESALNVPRNASNAKMFRQPAACAAHFFRLDMEVTEIEKLVNNMVLEDRPVVETIIDNDYIVMRHSVDNQPMKLVDTDKEERLARARGKQLVVQGTAGGAGDGGRDCGQGESL